MVGLGRVELLGDVQHAQQREGEGTFRNALADQRKGGAVEPDPHAENEGTDLFGTEAVRLEEHGVDRIGAAGLVEISRELGRDQLVPAGQALVEVDVLQVRDELVG